MLPICYADRLAAHFADYVICLTLEASARHTFLPFYNTMLFINAGCLSLVWTCSSRISIACTHFNLRMRANF
jgi:hypothetical protein